MEKRRTLSVRRSKPICGLLAQLLGDLPGEVPPRPACRAGSLIFIRLGRNESAPIKVLPPAKRLYAPCGAARRRRAQENAQAWKSAGHSVSGARRQSVVYLPSCLAISSAKFRPTRQAGRGALISFDWGEMNPPQSRFCLRQNACTRHAARPAGGGRRRTRRHGKAPDTQCPALEDNLWFTCPAA